MERLSKIIKESIKKVLKENSYINYKKKLTLDYLKDYLLLPENEKFINNIKNNLGDFINYLKIKKVIPDNDKNYTFKEIINNYNDYIITYHKDILNAKSKYIYNGDVSVLNQNSNLFLKYIGTSNDWLFHFTNNALEIINKGFYGLVDVNDIHCTFRNMKERKLGYGYAFAYDIENIPKTNDFDAKYLIMFKTYSIKVEHKIDNDVQNIFDVSQVDKDNLYVFRLDNIVSNEYYYDGNGERIFDKPLIGSMKCVYPLKYKNMVVKTPIDAIKKIENKKYTTDTNILLQNQNNKHLEKIVSFFKNLKPNVYIKKWIDETYIYYQVYDEDDNLIVSKDYTLRGLNEKLLSLGYELIEKLGGPTYNYYNSNYNNYITLKRNDVYMYITIKY